MKLKRKLVLGVGVNDADYEVQKKTEKGICRCAAYTSWTNMLNRCYSKPYLKRFPTYKGCAVSNEWLIFSNFKLWFDENYIDGYHLDKDIKIIGNKIYSEDNCLFIPSRVNLLLNKRNKKTGLPEGVDFHKASGKYRARINAGNGAIELGLFIEPDLAGEKYATEKNKVIESAAKEYPWLANYLVQHKTIWESSRK